MGFWGGPPAETRDGPYKEITIVKARFLRFTGVPRETAKSELLDGLGRFGRSQARVSLGTVQTGKSEVSGIPRPGMPETEVWARVPKPGPRGASPDAQKGGPQTPTFGPQAHYRPDGLLGPIPDLGSGTGPRGVLPKAGSGLETSVSGTLGLGRQTQTGGGFPELRLEDPRSTLEGAPEKDPIRRPDSEVGLGTPFGRGSQTGVGLNADFH